MIQLLFTVLAAEAGLATLLLFKTPLRKLAMLALDRLKRGKGPVMVRTVAATVLLVLTSSLHSMAKIHGHAGAGELDAPGALTPTDQVLLARHMLEASLMGYALFLALVIDRLHSYIREMRGLKKNLEAVSKQNKALEEAKSVSSDDDESKASQKDIAALNEEVKKLKLKLKGKKEEIKDAEAKAVAAKTQAEGLALKYDRLLEDNKHLHDQLQSEGKKDT
jgi:B-cell receptor-associated protein 31